MDFCMPHYGHFYIILLGGESATMQQTAKGWNNYLKINFIILYRDSS